MEDSILEELREVNGLSREDDSFDADLKIHANSALATLVQNGVVLPIVVKDTTQVWNSLKPPDKDEANEMFEQVKLFVFLKTKILFDPPPPSTVGPMTAGIDELLWRLRESYDIPEEEV